ncbi:hypothetical protein CDO52_09825 [Nocardiopsis gilva YIM 90087]|uniref:DUF4386 domain-containing protein n=1 Tax=Nocardiopsis gilva YIM 90087 TaxID=1235441 RepID=A0A223S4L6_9ACTN|nr:hypothetical protein [Nocardiopsis gilva]ASU83041.1 hypothetical protein CDO52_09825 [Nocardiopsis gilva YIM 90087]
MSTPTRNWFRAAAMAIAPVVLLAAFLYHPFVSGGAPTPEVVAEAAEADTTRWAAAHMLTLVAFALSALAFLALRGRLRDAGEERWSSWAFPLVIAGFVLLAGLPAIEMTIAGAIDTGVDTVALIEAVNPWFMTLLISGSVAFALGALAFAMGVVRGAIMSRDLTGLVAIALVVTALAMVAPPFWAFYVMAVAAIVVFWPVAWTTVRAGTRPEAAAEAEEGAQPAAPHPRTAEEQKGTFLGFGRRGTRAHH